MVFSLFLLWQLAAQAGSLPLVSVPTNLVANPAAEGLSGAPILSAHGRYVLFASTALTLLSPSNTSVLRASFPTRFNVFLRDRTAVTTVLVSAAFAEPVGGNRDSVPMGLSGDGRFVLLESQASNLVPNDTNNATDIFVRDMVNGTTVLVSAGLNGEAGDGDSREPVFTPDGRYVAFVSEARNLVADDTNGIADVFVRDLTSGTTVLASAMASGAIGWAASGSPEISADGRFVAFYSTATNLVDGVDTRGEIYLRDMVAGTNRLASVHARALLLAITGSADAVCYDHALSADGRFVAYATSATTNYLSGIILRYDSSTGLTDLVHTNAYMLADPREDSRTLDITPDGRFMTFLAKSPTSIRSVFVWDAESGITQVASLDPDSKPADGRHEWPSIDVTGRFVSFTSTATNLTTNSAIVANSIYVRDMELHQTFLANCGPNGAPVEIARSSFPRLCANGQCVGFESLGEESNSSVLVRDISAGTTELVSLRQIDSGSVTPDAASSVGSSCLSADGRYAVFTSLASNLVTNDNNRNRDVFVRDLIEGKTVLVSAGMDGASAAGMSFAPAISSNGRFVAFTSMATNISALDTSPKRDVYVRDLLTGVTVLGSVAMNGSGPGNQPSYSPILSGDGRYLFFRSTASDLATGSISPGSENLFVRDLQNATNRALTTHGVFNAVMSSGGRYLAYYHSFILLSIWDSLSASVVYTGTFESGCTPMAIRPDGCQVAYATSSEIRIRDRNAVADWTVGPIASGGRRPTMKFSGDGQYLAYCSSVAQALNDTNGTWDVYLYHIASGAKTLVSRAEYLDEAANAASDAPDISYDGRFVAYRSFASNLVSGDDNGCPDVFVYDRLRGRTELLSRNYLGDGSGNNRTMPPFFSEDGRILVFPSWASDLSRNDFNQGGDVFAFVFLYADIEHHGQVPTISWPTMFGQDYIVEFKNNPDDPEWQTLNGAIVITNNRASVRDLTAGAESPQRLYRVVGH